MVILTQQPSLEKVDLRVGYPNDAPKIIDFLRQFCRVKYLTVNLEIVELLSSSVHLISNQPSPFAKLKSLEIYPHKYDDYEDWEEWQQPMKTNFSTEVKSYLLDRSPSATFTMVLHEEMAAVTNLQKVRVLLDELKFDLDLWKIVEECSKAETHDKGKEIVENRGAQLGAEMPLHIWGSMKHIHSCWEHLSVRIICDTKKVSRIFSKLKDIEESLKDVPALRKVKMQACFASMCAEADTLMNELLDLIKIQSDMKRSRLCTHFHELAKA